MLNLLKALRQDEHGVILSAEIVIIGSLLVIGLITGLTCLQQSVNGELKDLAGAIGALDQSYAYSAHRKQGFGDQCCAWTAGSSFVNCEQKSDKCTDIIGCTEPCVQGINGCCEKGILPVPAVGAACGTCGGRAGGCGVCGGGVRASGGFSVDGYQAPLKARCIESGVPKLKVSEWPLDYPSQISIPSHDVMIPSPVGECADPVLSLPQGRVIHEHSVIVVPHHGHHHGETIIEHAAPVQTHPPVEHVQPVHPMTNPPAQPIPSNDPLPMPTQEQPMAPSPTT